MPDPTPILVEPSTWTSILFVVIVVALSTALVVAIARLDEDDPGKTMVIASFAAGGWLGATGAIADSGLLFPDPLPIAMLIFLAVVMASMVGLAFSRVGTRLVDGTPIAALVGVQVFRLPLELILYAWYVEGVLPVQVTFRGHNFDIVTGIGAAVVGYLVWRGKVGRRAVLAFNLVGTALLLTVATIAVLSAPTPMRAYPDDPPVMLAFAMPTVWIVSVCVAGALLGHLLVFRWLWRTRGD